MMCLDVSPEPVPLCSVKGGAGVTDTPHRYCQLSVLRTQLLGDGKVR